MVAGIGKTGQLTSETGQTKVGTDLEGGERQVKAEEMVPVTFLWAGWVTTSLLAASVCVHPEVTRRKASWRRRQLLGREPPRWGRAQEQVADTLLVKLPSVARLGLSAHLGGLGGG